VVLLITSFFSSSYFAPLAVAGLDVVLPSVVVGYFFNPPSVTVGCFFNPILDPAPILEPPGVESPLLSLEVVYVVFKPNFVPVLADVEEPFFVSEALAVIFYFISSFFFCKDSLVVSLLALAVLPAVAAPAPTLEGPFNFVGPFKPYPILETRVGFFASS
jgi:hypothetical protein